jgi:biotin carboxylase
LKTVLIVDPFSTGKLYSPLLNNQGVRCIAVVSSRDLPQHFTCDLVEDNFADIFYWDDQPLDALKALSVTAVIAGCETAIYLTDYLTESLGVVGNSSRTSDLRRNKFAMQKALEEQGLRHIPSNTLKSPAQITDFVATLDPALKYVIKPLNSAATQGVVFAEGGAAVRAALDDAAWNQRNDLGEINLGFIVQPFISGPEYVVDMVAFEGTFIIASVCRYAKIHKNGSHFVYESLDTLDPRSPDLQPLIDYARKAAAALDIRVGPIHMEIIWSDAGPVMIEAGGRLHGGIAPQLFQQVYQPDLLSLSIDSYLGRSRPDTEEAGAISQGRIGFFCSNENRTFNAPPLSTLQSVAQDSAYCGHKYFITPGDTTPVTIDFATCPGLFWLHHPEISQLDASTESLRKQLWG